MPPSDYNGEDRCAVCNQTAPFLFRDRAAGTVTRWCMLHVPGNWGLSPSLTRLLEEAYLELAAKKDEPAEETTGPSR